MGEGSSLKVRWGQGEIEVLCESSAAGKKGEQSDTVSLVVRAVVVLDHKQKFFQVLEFI